MFIPKSFRLNDADHQRIVDEYPLATLINRLSNDSGMAIDVQHIPLYWYHIDTGTQVLRGHIARANPLWEQTLASPIATCVFQGPQAYITPNWYPSKKRHGKVVPTWNYIVVHIRGEIQFFHDNAWKRDMLIMQTEKMENDIEKGQAKSWSLTDAPESYVEKMLNAIVGIELKIESIEAQYKLSQNQKRDNYEGVMHGLKTSAQVTAKEMLNHIQKP